MATPRATILVPLSLITAVYITAGLLLGLVAGGSFLLLVRDLDPTAATIMAAPITVPVGILLGFSTFLYRQNNSNPFSPFYLTGGFAVGSISVALSLLILFRGLSLYNPDSIYAIAIASANGGPIGMVVVLSALLYRQEKSDAFGPFFAVVVFLMGCLSLTMVLVTAGISLDTEAIFLVIITITPLSPLLSGSVWYVYYVQKQRNPLLPPFVAMGYLLGSVSGTFVIAEITNDVGISMLPGTLIASPVGMLLTLAVGFAVQRQSNALTPLFTALGYSVGIVLGTYTFLQAAPQEPVINTVLGSFVGGPPGLLFGLSVAFYYRRVPNAYYPFFAACGFIFTVVFLRMVIFDDLSEESLALSAILSAPVGILLLFGIYYSFYVPDDVSALSTAHRIPEQDGSDNTGSADSESSGRSGSTNSVSEPGADKTSSTASKLSTTTAPGSLLKNTVDTKTAERNLENVTDVPPPPPQLSISYDEIDKGEPLGSGGNADVYRATTTRDGETIELALKEPRVSSTLHTETIKRLITEARTWQELADHDHIVSVVDYGSEPLPWIGMEYMDAGHLGERAGNLGLDQALWTAITTTRGVWHAHRRGVAHLDLKPENILFRSVDDGWDMPKVADWGLAKRLLEHSTSTEGLSVHYAAPEQFDDDYGSTDERTDIYQLGAVFYELFTGRPPFEGQAAAVMHKTLSEQPLPPSEVDNSLPAAIDDVLLTALAKQKSERYESVLYLRDGLSQLFTQDEDTLKFRSASTITGSTGTNLGRDSSSDTDSPASNTTATDQDTTSGELEYDDIEIGDPISSDGTTTVYRARVETETGTKPAALKQLRTDKTLHSDSVKEFTTEARRWQKLAEHDSIVDVWDWGTEPLPWIALEYMNRGSLNSVLEQVSPLQTVVVGSQIAEAIHFAHTRGTAHLSLTPSNVLLHSTDDKIILKISNWGIGKLTLTHSTNIGELNVSYVAPEQFNSKYGEPGQASDVYALGVLCYELFTGTRPFGGAPADVLDAKLAANITPPTELNTQLPQAVDTLIETAVAPDPSDRYESVLYLRDALQDLA